MRSTDIRNGRRGHAHLDGGPSSPHRLTPHASEVLSAEQAAPLLGCTVRHVRRLIAQGDLAGHKDPYRTWRGAVDAYRRRAQGVEGDVVAPPGADMQMSAGGQQPTGALDRQEEDSESTAVMVAIAAELASARDQIERLARENGRLAAQLEQVEMLQAPAAVRRGSSVRRLVRWLSAGGRA